MTRRRYKPTKARSCDGKLRYDSREEALAAASSCANQTGTAFGRLTVYRCGQRHHRHWHYGHAPRRRG